MDSECAEMMYVQRLSFLVRMEEGQKDRREEGKKGEREEGQKGRRAEWRKGRRAEGQKGGLTKGDYLCYKAGNADHHIHIRIPQRDSIQY